jgi:hypothetical protein
MYPGYIQIYPDTFGIYPDISGYIQIHPNISGYIRDVSGYIRDISGYIQDVSTSGFMWIHLDISGIPRLGGMLRYVTEKNTNYALRATRHRAADRPAACRAYRYDPITTRDTLLIFSV